MIRAQKVRLYPNNVQAAQLQAACDLRGFAWNQALARHEQTLHNDEKWMSGYDLSKWWTAARRDEDARRPEPAWWASVSQLVPRNAIADLHRALEACAGRKKGGKRKIKTRYPRPKKGHCADTATFSWGSGRPSSTWTAGRYVKIPKIGMVRMRPELRFVGDVLTVTVSKRAGKWYCSFVVEDGAPSPEAKTGDVEYGIDMGVGDRLATRDDGLIYENPRAHKLALARLRRLQRKLARQQKGSARRAKTKLAIARTHERVRHVRKDYRDKATSELAMEADAVHVEDLHVAGMIRNRRLARTIADAGMAEFVSALEQKCAREGTRFSKIDRWEPSSKTCSACGHKRESMPLAVRRWKCDRCGTEHDRDINAAKNVMAAGQAATGRGEGIMPRAVSARGALDGGVRPRAGIARGEPDEASTCQARPSAVANAPASRAGATC